VSTVCLEERLVRVIHATPEQQAMIDLILASSPPKTTPLPFETKPAVSEPRSEGDGEFITKVILAQRMRKSLRMVDNLLKRGLPHYKVGRSVLFRWPEVEAFLAVNCRVSRRTNS
jgi:hypothetical protein